MNGAVVLFGEVMLGLRPPGFERIVQASSLEMRFSGAEANAGVSLVNYGRDAVVATRVPSSSLGDACLRYLRRYGLDTSRVAHGGERLGVYYVETGSAQRASTVLYDRAGSAFATSTPDDYDWDALLADASWLHFSGTAPALGDGVVAALEAGLAVARRHGVTVSCDLNYRNSLWSRERAGEVLRRLMPSVDLLIGNEEDAEAVFGIRAGDSDVTAGRLEIDSYAEVARRLVDRFGFSSVATTLRESVSASHNRWGALLYTDGVAYLSQRYEITPIVDRIGAGDSFSGALIHAQLEAWEPQRAIEFAAAASCLKHSIPGDFNAVSADEVHALMAGNASGRIQR